MRVRIVKKGCRCAAPLDRGDWAYRKSRGEWRTF